MVLSAIAPWNDLTLKKLEWFIIWNGGNTQQYNKAETVRIRGGEVVFI
jgi:hypothetical protein